MKKFIVVLMLVAGSCLAGTSCNDSIVSTDQLTHFGVGFISGSVIEAISGGTKPLFPIGFTMALASMKETVDHQTTNEKTGKRNNHWCWKDWGMTVAGGIAGVYTVKLGIKIYKSNNTYCVAKVIKF